MAKLIWDQVGERTYETGVSNCVLYVGNAQGGYDTGIAWSGITSVQKTPEGGDVNDQYADNIKYLSLQSAETLGGTIEAYTYPTQFEQCDGNIELETGVYIGQQPRKMFGLAYKSIYGNDVLGNDYGEKIHILYGCKTEPSERQYQTINDSPEAMTFSWGFKTTAVTVAGHKPTGSIVIDLTKVTEAQKSAIENALFGGELTEPTILLPDAISALLI